MQNSKIKPTGRKGRENINRIKELMNLTPIKENVDRSVVELTKIGPDGKAYAIVKENSEYYIKVSDKVNNLVTEDFKYIGGLQNKKREAYPSYSKATKKLNMKFIDLAEAYGAEKVWDILKNDNLMVEVEDINGKEAPVDKETSGDNVATGDNIGKDDFEKAKADGTEDGDTGEHAEDYVMEEIELTENEVEIDAILSGKKRIIKERAISISNAMKNMDNIIDEATGSSDTKVEEILSNLSESEVKTLVAALKKKV